MYKMKIFQYVHFILDVALAIIIAEGKGEYNSKTLTSFTVSNL